MRPRMCLCAVAMLGVFWSAHGQTCTPEYTSYLGDGYCDNSDPYNTANCNWDGGDCCPDTCVISTYSCTNYACLDPGSSTYDSTTESCADGTVPPYPSYLGDGYCDSSEPYNTANCGWDSGDCCEDTCVVSTYSCTSFSCEDPSSSTYDAEPIVCSDGAEPEYSSYLGDGYCDSSLEHLNSLNCGWDGGDCCEETCVSSSLYTCGESSSYGCLDPSQATYYECKATCYSYDCNYYVSYGFTCDELETTYGCDCSNCDCPTTTAFTTTETPDCPASHDGDGYCDTGARGNKGCNTAAYNYDGGDCCASTCVGDYCGAYGYDCQDPDASNSLVCNVGTYYGSWLGDAYCDSWGVFNTAACDWDGGDCCPDTCAGGARGRKLDTDVDNYYLYGGGYAYLCGHDSTYQCLDPDSDSSHCNVGYESWLGDGSCDVSGYYNTAACGWDLGDCCDSTCVDPTEFPGCQEDNDCDFYVDTYGDTYGYTCQILEDTYGFDCTGCASCEPPCGFTGKVCVDPDATDYGQCEADGAGAGNGICDNYGALNTATCGWDGGDCCADTCVDPVYGEDAAGCIDTQTYNCDYYVESFGYTCDELTNTYDFDCTGCFLCESPCEYDAGKVCLDPDSTEYEPCDVAFPDFVGDSYCDGQHGNYNTQACNWDGGDCCQVTCEEQATLSEAAGIALEHKCNETSYNCLDPEYSCIGDWTQWGNCDATCGGGTSVRSFEIEQDVVGDGEHCDNHGVVLEEKACNTDYCDEDNDGIVDPLDSCWEDAENDVDADNVCGNLDNCPYDADNDADADDLCSNVDPCPFDPANDFDQDGLCANVDSCAIDPDNDADGDLICDPALACPNVGDEDSDDICTDVDSCDLDAGNDIDSDQMCADVDSCEFDADNDADNDGICDNLDDCVAFESLLGNGECNVGGNYNTKNCGWDGGDCCEHTCRTTTQGAYYTYEYACDSDAVYSCQDPLWTECEYEYPSTIGDGHCDANKRGNTLACSWDGGDCCASTCVTTYYACGYDDYDCLDPDANNDVCTIYYTSFIGDGHCDSSQGQYNTAACSWDGGDCCASSCDQDAEWQCGHYAHYDCLDPDETNSDNCAVGYLSRIGDGICDMLGQYNMASCDWDGGDCCPDTCVVPESEEEPTGCGDGDYEDCDYWIDLYPTQYTCSIMQNGFGWNCAGCLLCDSGCNDVLSCEDPESSNYGLKECIGVESYIGDGQCDYGSTDDENTAACNWDGGDCCPDTCANYLCGYYAQTTGNLCLDPDSNYFDGCQPTYPEYIGDAMCDSSEEYNNAACAWDGGDCCALTCLAEDSAYSYECGEYVDYNCIDPEFACIGSWNQWSNCDATCGGGTSTRTFYITTNATEDGAECVGSHQEVVTKDCNTALCDADGDAIEDDKDSCKNDANNDIDGDGKCGDVDDCPLDAADDSDADDVCDTDDACPVDAANDYDGDSICGNVDSCPEDATNDDDGDNVCNAGRACAAADDADSDEICSDDDSCPEDAGNDYDSDMLCHTEDSCPMDALNDADGDGLCDGEDACVALESKLGDGFCDSGDVTLTGVETYNSPACSWDGGDCCAQSCLILSDAYAYVDAMVPCDQVVESPVYVCEDPLYFDCEADVASYVGDGYCDDHKRTNVAACNWDGGDCCASTCVSSDSWNCGDYIYECLDPDANNDVCNVRPSYIGDGYCDASFGSFNTEVCDWDGGDCCSSTCVSSDTYGCGHYAENVCLDPDADNDACVVGYDSYLGDGWCDLVGHYNTLACDWDGGDCCPSSCSGPSCGSTAVSCQDPESPNYGYVSCSGVESYIGDGYCDSGTGENTLACDWDGGDCCEDTCNCVSACWAECGEYGYLCEDPDSSEFDECGAEYLEYVGDAYCDFDPGYNTAECAWDGGDCCEVTCNSAGGEHYGYSCGANDFNCLDPSYANTVSNDDSAYSVIGCGFRNEISESSSKSSIGGGQANQVYKADSATVSGGFRNVVFSKYGSISGGFESQVIARLGTVVGGSRNTVTGRHSVALGYKGYAKAAVAMVAAFNGDVPGDEGRTDINAECFLDAEEDNTIKICADTVLFNDLDLLQILGIARRLESSTEEATALRQRVEDLSNVFAMRRAEVMLQVATQTARLEAQARQLTA